MPRFYFDIEDEGHLTKDEEGLLMSDHEEARSQAIGVLPDIARDVLPDGNSRSFVATVRDEAGQHIFRATLTLHATWLSEDPVTAIDIGVRP